jgi:hypothetical protein
MGYFSPGKILAGDLSYNREYRAGLHPAVRMVEVMR